MKNTTSYVELTPRQRRLLKRAVAEEIKRAVDPEEKKDLTELRSLVGSANISPLPRYRELTKQMAVVFGKRSRATVERHTMLRDLHHNRMVRAERASDLAKEAMEFVESEF